jgi:hypothetical protein
VLAINISSGRREVVTRCQKCCNSHRFFWYKTSMEVNLSGPLVTSFMLLATILTYLKTVSIILQAGTLVDYDRLSAKLHVHTLTDWDSVSFLSHADVLTNWNKVSLTLQSRILISWERVSFQLQADILKKYERKYNIIHVPCSHLLHNIYSNNCTNIKMVIFCKYIPPTFSAYNYHRQGSGYQKTDS